MLGRSSLEDTPGSLSQNALVGIHLIESIRDILGKIFSRTKRNKQLKDDARAFTNVVCTTA